MVQINGYYMFNANGYYYRRLVLPQEILRDLEGGEEMQVNCTY